MCKWFNFWGSMYWNSTSALLPRCLSLAVTTLDWPAMSWVELPWTNQFAFVCVKQLCDNTHTLTLSTWPIHFRSKASDEDLVMKWWRREETKKTHFGFIDATVMKHICPTSNHVWKSHIHTDIQHSSHRLTHSAYNTSTTYPPVKTRLLKGLCQTPITANCKTDYKGITPLTPITPFSFQFFTIFFSLITPKKLHIYYLMTLFHMQFFANKPWRIKGRLRREYHH